MITIHIPLYRIGVSKVDLQASLDWYCPIPAENDEPTIVSRFYVDPAIIERLYA